MADKLLAVLDEYLVQPGYDAYNSTAPFKYHDRIVIASRVEPKTDELSSKVFFYSKNSQNKWEVRNDLPNFQIQDPFITVIKDNYILGGVKLTLNKTLDRCIDYTTVLYSGTQLENLKLIYVGPNRMKGIRLLELKDGRIILFTRPQKKSKYDPLGRGRIAFTLIKDLFEINEGVKKAKIINEMFSTEEWGGPNELLELENGNIAVLGHKAHFGEKGSKHYHVITFEFNPNTKEFSHFKTVIKRDVFPQEIKPKREDLFDVLYPGGVRKSSNDGKSLVYLGIGDACNGYVEIDDKELFSSTPIWKFQIN